MKIEKADLVIRSAVTEDAHILTSWWNNGEIMAHAGFPKGLGQTVERTLQQIGKNQWGLSQLCLIEIDALPVGEMNYRILEHSAEIGIKICDAAYQNKGYGSRLLCMLIDFLFLDEALNQAASIDRILLDTDLQNTRAQHVYEKIGFRKKSVNRNAWQDQLGVWQTSVDYEMSRADYDSKKCSQENSGADGKY